MRGDETGKTGEHGEAVRVSSVPAREAGASIPPSTLRIVGLGGGVGGLAAVRSFFRSCPPRAGLAFVVVLHETRDVVLVRGELQSDTALKVVKLVEDVPPAADHIYLVPHTHDVSLKDGCLTLETRSNEVTPIDKFFCSLAASAGRDAICVVLSGHGTDGTIGLKFVKEKGGLTLVQDPTEAEVSEMPRHALASGLVDVVMASSALPRRMLMFTEGVQDNPDAHTPSFGSAAPPETGAIDDLRELLALVRIRTGHDFQNYKRPTLRRRVARRMQVCETGSLDAYLRHLRENPNELQALLRDFLISVTSFFRDTESFAALDARVLAKRFADNPEGDQVRIWVAGCATGEEAYSIAILCAEHMALSQYPPSVQIFATDIDNDALVEARAGRYPVTIQATVSTERLDRFFSSEGGTHFRIRKEIRDMVLFSPHNLLRDPPFSKLDLVTCRNVLIYLNRQAQERVLNILHFGLRPDGHLFLGSSESAENASGLFTAVDSMSRVYERRLVSAPVALDSTPSLLRWQTSAAARPAATVERGTSPGDLHLRLLEHYAPPSVLVNEEFEVLHLSEHAGKFLSLGAGEPTRNLLRLVHEELRLEVRGALYGARQGEGPSRGAPVFLDLAGHSTGVIVSARSVDVPGITRGVYLVMFEEHEDVGNSDPPMSTRSANKIEPLVRELEAELERTREQLRTTVEQYETSVEELKASNEELHAINEELRAATEELETSKEELQSVNEELLTLNHEMKEKIDEISRTNNDLQNLMSSTEIGVVFLDRSLCISRFTPRARDLLNIIATDIGRPLSHLTHRLEELSLSEAAATVLRTSGTLEYEVRSSDGRRYLARLHPYRSSTGQPEGVVLTFLDITKQKETEDALRASDARFRLALATAPVLMLNTDASLRYVWGHINGHDVDVVGKTDGDLFAPDEAAYFARLKKEVLDSGQSKPAELTLTIDGSTQFYEGNIEPIRGKAGIEGVCCAAVDVSRSKRAELGLREADRRKDEFLATLAHELRNPLTPLRSSLDLLRHANGDLTLIDRVRGKMEAQVTQIVQLVDDLMDVARITQRRVHLRLEMVSLRHIVDATLDATHASLMKAGHTLQVDLPTREVELRVDFTRITQILTNLLLNAIKYTPPGGDIALRAQRIDGEKMVEIRIRDSGVGLDPDSVRQVFDMFSQAHDTLHRSQGGIGIGLALVKQLAELHGGTVEAFSEGKGLGSEFVVRLPTHSSLRASSVERSMSASTPGSTSGSTLVSSSTSSTSASSSSVGSSKAPSSSMPPSSSQPPPSLVPASRRRVLIVDDNLDITELLAMLLEKRGYEVFQANDGETALRMAAEVAPDTVLLDLGMPDMDGNEVARKLRASALGERLLIVVQSGRGRPEDIETSRQAGADHYLVKPIEITTLQALLETAHLAKSRAAPRE